MSTTARTAPSPARWSTAAAMHADDTAPMELQVLGEHLVQCRPRHARLFALRCGVEATQGFVAGRFVTTLALGAVLLALGLLVL